MKTHLFVTLVSDVGQSLAAPKKLQHIHKIYNRLINLQENIFFHLIVRRMTRSRLTIKSLNEEIIRLRQKIEEIDLLKIKVKDLEAALKGIQKQNENINKHKICA